MTCFVGLDVSMEETAYCVRGPEGRIPGQGKVPTDPDAIAAAPARFGRPARVVLETGRMANWLHRQLVARDLPAVRVDARQAHAVLSQMPNKTDANDAAMLAELARTGFYRAVRVKSEAAQGMRALLKARDSVVRQRMDLDNTIRGLLTSMGVRLPKGPRRWAERVELALEANEALALALRPPLRLREDLARLVAPRGQADVRAHRPRPGEPGRVVDGGHEGVGGDRADPGHAHRPAARLGALGLGQQPPGELGRRAGDALAQAQ